MAGSRSPRRVVAAVVATLALFVGALAGAGPASAAPAAPGGLSPTSDVSTTTPVFTWSRVSGASQYDVEVYRDSSLTSKLFGVRTANRRTVPTKALPDGPLYWRVRGVTSSGVTGAWSGSGFSVSPSSPPQPVAPANGTTLDQPDNPPLLRWSAVQGATSYQIEVDADSNFLNATSYTTKTTSYVVPDAVANGSYYWHVRAQRASGVYTDWSEIFTYNIGSLRGVDGTNIQPVNDANQAVTDIVFDWDPVRGAKTYDLRVSPDQSFNTNVYGQATGATLVSNIKSTRYSPPTTYPNGQYYWQVRARNTRGEAMDWSAIQSTWAFQRSWNVKPSLVYPADSYAAVGDDFFFQWTPVPQATKYRLDVSQDANFSPGKYTTCYTAGTTYAAGYLKNPGADLCMPGQGGTYYWRVQAIDAPANVPSLYSDVHHFVYDSGLVQPISPLNGDTVPVPTLSWEPVRDTEKYRVILKYGTSTQTITTASTSWTPTGKTALDPTKGPFSWTVQSVDANGNLSPLPQPIQFNIGGSLPSTGTAPLTPASIPAGARFPNLTWEPDPSAAYYQINVGTSGSGYWDSASSNAPILSTQYPYPAATDTGDRYLAPGSYNWQVESYNASGQKLGSGPVGTFQITELPAVTGQRIALDGTSLDADKACTNSLNAPAGSPTICSSVPSTPVLDWSPVPDAGLYMVYVARDRALTNMVFGTAGQDSTIPTTSNTRWTPTWGSSPVALPDSQAGSAYYWFIRPCKTVNVCAPDPFSTSEVATNAFTKRSPAVETTSPGVLVSDGTPAPPVSGDITFTWTDYRDTNAATTYADTGENPNQSAMKYRIEVSTDSTFATLLDYAEVDQTTYTPYAKTYPEGTLFWRVQAIDGQGNHLTWSATRTFLKANAGPDLMSPVGYQATDGTEAFRWSPVDAAGSYRVELYKNGDDAFSPVNRVFSTTTNQTAYSYTAPLPASTLPYVWRVQRLDADGLPGAWSSAGYFYSTGSTPSLTSPTSGATVSATDSLFTWGAVPRAVTYTFERRLVGATSNTETVTTNALAWAPTTVIPVGSWEWRVTALDLGNAVLGSTDWSRFTVPDTTRPTVTFKSPTTMAYRTTNFTAKFSEPVKGVSKYTMKIYKKGSTTPLGAVVSLSSDKKTATLNPNRDLRVGSYYIVKLTSGITDLSGNKLSATSWTVKAY